MLPERCSIREKGRDCQMPPEFVMSVKAKDGEYMVGVTCERHKKAFADKLEILQKDGKVPQGTISFSGLRPVGTNCIRIDPNDLIEL
ncbi:MAG: hypothetical protein E6K93_02315 [Thaumarchaeota archaeon]|nr:MAG: hypothetical protein E6K93_02315 [Nitrososphaerota archaeon]